MKKVILIIIMFGAMLWAIEPFTGTCGPTPWWLRDNSGSQNEDRYRGICVINDSLAWVVGWDRWWNGIVWKRTGRKHSHTWKDMTDSVPNAISYHLNDVYFVTPTTGWIVGEKYAEPNKYRGVVYKTTNGGTDWVDITPSESITGPHPTPFLKVKFANIDYGYISCGNGVILKTTNGGQSWSRTQSDPWNNDNNISVWYNGLWVDSNNSDKLWVGGDAFGVLAKSDSGGISWTSYQPSEFETTYTFPQGAGAPYGTRLANFDVEFVNSDTCFVALSYGKIGETTDGGETWTRSTYQPTSTWFRDVTEGRSDTCFAVGNCSVVHRFNHVDSQECFDNLITRRGSDLYCVDAKGSYYPYSAGDSWYGTTIRQRYKVANFSSCDAKAVWDPTNRWYRVVVKWGSSAHDNLRGWNVTSNTFNYLARHELESTPGDVYPPQTDSIVQILHAATCRRTNYYWHIYALDSACQYSGHPGDSAAFQLCGVAKVSEGQLDSLENAFYSVWGPAQNLQAYDRSGDNGNAIIISFEPSCSTSGGNYKIGRSRSYDGPYHYIGGVFPPESLMTFVDSAARNGITFYYVVAIYDPDYSTYRSEYAGPVSAIAEDNLTPGIVINLNGEFEPGTQTIKLTWDPPAATHDIAGYWVCPIPPGSPDYYLNHSSPISRTMYRFPIEPQWLEDTLEYYVAAMDYSGHISEWGNACYVYAGAGLGLSNTPLATGLSNSRKMFYDGQSKIMAVFTHNDSIFYRSSTDEGVSWSEKQNLTSGIYPGMILDGDELYLACVNRNPADEPHDPTEGRDYYSPGEYDWKLLFKKTDTGDWEAQTSALDSVHQDNDGGSVEFSAPCIAITDDDTVHVAFAKTMYTQVLSNWYWKWKIYYGNFHMTNPQVREWTVIDSAVEQSSRHPPEECPFNQSDPAMVADHTGSVHLAYGLYSAIKYRYRLGNIWSGIQTISGLGTHAQQSIGINGNELTVVWSGKPWPESETQILCRRRFITSGWGNVERIDTGDNASIYPVTLKNHTLWCEEVSAGNYDIYYSHLSGYSWSTPVNLTNSSDRAMLPHMAYNGPDYKFYYIYTARDTLPYWVLFDEYQFEETPKYGFNLGADEPSHATVCRDGFVNYGGEAYESIDCSDSVLTYRLTGFDTNSEYDVLWDWYHEMNTSMHIKIKIDNNFEFVYLVPYNQPITQRYPIPPICYADSEITIRLEKIGQGTAILSGFAIYEKQNQGGGPQSSADGLITGKLMLQIQNPTTSRVKMVYQLPTACEAKIKIYDITGSLVRSINLPKRQGMNEIIWDSSDNIGRKVATGIYFCRLETEQKDITQKIILLK